MDNAPSSTFAHYMVGDYYRAFATGFGAHPASPRIVAAFEDERPGPDHATWTAWAHEVVLRRRPCSPTSRARGRRRARLQRRDRGAEALARADRRQLRVPLQDMKLAPADSRAPSTSSAYGSSSLAYVRGVYRAIRRCVPGRCKKGGVTAFMHPEALVNGFQKWLLNLIGVRPKRRSSLDDLRRYARRVSTAQDRHYARRLLRTTGLLDRNAKNMSNNMKNHCACEQYLRICITIRVCTIQRCDVDQDRRYDATPVGLPSAIPTRSVYLRGAQRRKRMVPADRCRAARAMIDVHHHMRLLVVRHQRQCGSMRAFKGGAYPRRSRRWIAVRVATPMHRRRLRR